MTVPPRTVQSGSARRAGGGTAKGRKAREDRKGPPFIARHVPRLATVPPKHSGGGFDSLSGCQLCENGKSPSTVRSTTLTPSIPWPLLLRRRPPIELGPAPMTRSNTSKSSVPTDTETKPLPVPRTAEGRFPKGQSGNPLGRVKGTKNKITIARLMLEEVLRDQLTDRGPELMKKAIDMAMGDKKRPGNDKIMRVLLDKMLASPRGEEDTTGGDRDVKVIIENHTGPKTVKPAIDGASVRISPPKDSD